MPQVRLFPPLWGTLLSLFASSLLFAASPVVKRIDIEGNKKIETAAIRTKILTSVGDRLDSQVVSNDIRAVFSLGYFDDVEAFEDEAAGGVRLIFKVSEKPTIADIRFEGASELNEEELEEEAQLKAFEVLDIHKLNLAVDRLSEKYEEKGYYLADIRYDVEPVKDGENEVDVVFHIDENEKIKVRSITITGNNLVSDGELKKVMQTQEGGFFSWLTGSGTYREAVFERDIATLQFYYGTLGYVRARIGAPEVTVTPDKKFIYINFHVTEGEKYNVGDVDFSGDLLFSRDELHEDLELKKGEVFNTDVLRRETLRYTEKYGDLGYAFANVVPQPEIHDDTKTVDVTFEIDKGRRVYVGEITVVGNTKTKDKVVRRELQLREGELFSGSKLRRSRENVTRLGFFDNVEFNRVSRKNNPNVVDIEIKVTERSTGQLVIGAGYASGDIGFTAQAQLSQQNFLGNGQVASLSAQIMTGRKFYEFNLGFDEPYVGSSRWSLGGRLYHVRRIVTALEGVPTFQEMKTGFSINLGHPVFEYTNLSMTYKFEKSTVDESTIIDKSIIHPNQVNGYASTLMAKVVSDKRDDRFDPRKGWYGELSAELAGLGGDRRYFRTRGAFKFFHPIIWDFIFRFHLTGANIAPWGGTAVPINELFIQGGLFSLRGYDFLSIGPKRTISGNPADLSAEAFAANLAGRQFVIGGHNEVLIQAEIEFPLSGRG
ncbi:MAG: outer membrane protein assembly factor BamA [Bdellovibrionaceae bacterium]|nr:outer membrane protein assembly factor BamA [Pseudobdellovibrionaceae bacterium]